MDMYNKQSKQTMNPASEQYNTVENKGIAHRILATNWGLAVIGALVALAIGVSMLHGGYVESQASQVPEAEIETVSVTPIS